jgi:hypothetical protein
VHVLFLAVPFSGGVGREHLIFWFITDFREVATALDHFGLPAPWTAANCQP